MQSGLTIFGSSNDNFELTDADNCFVEHKNLKHINVQ